ncbi:glycosyltransferase family 2 protein [Nodosilinea sp. LEGE 07298]|uniref:glycosyltransferase family 2 protein n=1 Tax=Nodosilinea sp. LEGE 07298 TaxID=2777970 RepID=UPI00187F6360|nr:glycosyltransferase family 2 protein [Nodosilinea sp. LEGE 07298]MBE9109133.1 glycosyltransferase family 2 protein [Nodosilinea sp. LEGE 07298]
MSLSVSALITNFKTWPLTQRCISELMYWSGDNLATIFVVDDASNEEIPEFLPKKVQVIQNSQNKGYVASVNVGFSQIREDVVLLLDSDAYPLAELVQNLTRIFESNSAIGAVGFNLVDEQSNPTGSYRPEPHALQLLLGQKLESRVCHLVPFFQSRPICLYSCGMAVRRAAFEDVGGFDEGFDFLDADVDFSMNLRRAGWQIHYQPDLCAFHKGGGSFQTTATRVARYHKNRWRLLEKHGYLPPSTIFKAALAMRHTLEYCILKIGGRRLFKDPISLQDKLDGRQKLLQGVWSGYGNQN